MAHPTVVINNVQYQNCGEVDIPKQGGGTAKFYDASEADAAAGNVLSGKKYIGPNGQDTALWQTTERPVARSARKPV